MFKIYLHVFTLVCKTPCIYKNKPTTYTSPLQDQISQCTSCRLASSVYSVFGSMLMLYNRWGLQCCQSIKTTVSIKIKEISYKSSINHVIVLKERNIKILVMSRVVSLEHLPVSPLPRLRPAGIEESDTAVLAAISRSLHRKLMDYLNLR